MVITVVLYILIHFKQTSAASTSEGMEFVVSAPSSMYEYSSQTGYPKLVLIMQSIFDEVTVTILTQHFLVIGNSAMYFSKLVILKSLNPEYYGTPELYFGPGFATGYRWVYNLKGSQPFGVVVSMESSATIAETFTAVPVSGWGEMYFVIALRTKFSVVLMTNELENTLQFKLRFEGINLSLQLHGSSLRHGESFTIRLKPYGSYAISHCGNNQPDGSITGSRIRGVRPFGVVSGNCDGWTQARFCGNVDDPDLSIESPVNPVAEMLLPTKTAGISFILFSATGGMYAGHYVIMSVHVSHVKVSISAGLHSKEVDTIDLKQAGDWNVYKAENKILMADGPVIVVYVQNSSCVTDRGGYKLDPHSMMLVIPFSLFYHMYIPLFPATDMKQFIVVVIQTQYAHTLNMLYVPSLERFRGDPIVTPESVHDKIIVSGSWIIYRYEVTRGTNILLVSLRTRFGCYILGTSHESTYMHPAGFISSNINKNTCKKTLDTMIVGDLLDNDCDGYIDEEILNLQDDDFTILSDRTMYADVDLGISFSKGSVNNMKCYNDTNELI